MAYLNEFRSEEYERGVRAGIKKAASGQRVDGSDFAGKPRTWVRGFQAGLRKMAQARLLTKGGK